MKKVPGGGKISRHAGRQKITASVEQAAYAPGRGSTGNFHPE